MASQLTIRFAFEVSCAVIRFVHYLSSSIDTFYLPERNGLFPEERHNKKNEIRAHKGQPISAIFRTLSPVHLHIIHSPSWSTLRSHTHKLLCIARDYLDSIKMDLFFNFKWQTIFHWNRGYFHPKRISDSDSFFSQFRKITLSCHIGFFSMYCVNAANRIAWEFEVRYTLAANIQIIQPKIQTMQLLRFIFFFSNNAKTI